MRVPYSTEQGIILAEQGLLAREQGILSVGIGIIANKIFGTKNLGLIMASRIEDYALIGDTSA